MLICKKCKCDEYYLQEKGKHTGAYCQECDKWLKWVPKKPGELKIWLGKYKGRKIGEIEIKKLREFLEWLETNKTPGSEKLHKKIEEYLNTNINPICPGCEDYNCKDCFDQETLDNLERLNYPHF